MFSKTPNASPDSAAPHTPSSSSMTALISPCCSEPACTSARTISRHPMPAEWPTPSLAFQHTTNSSYALAIGPIFLTGSKLNPDPVVGIDQLRTLRAITSKPLVAIGGITRETAPAVLEAGADSIAVIGDLYPEACTKASLRTRAEEWLAICSRTSLRP